MSEATATDGLPERPVDPDWLALREPADARARDAAADTLLPPLLRHLRDRRAADDGTSRQPAGAGVGVGDGDGDGVGLRVVDLGAGTGANLRWLAPRLAAVGAAGAPEAQRWTLVDHDPRLHAWGPAPSTTVRADVADLPRLLTDLGAADLVTATALLDLLDEPALTAVVDAVVTAGVPALLSLSVTGAVTTRPPDPLDDVLAEAFDAHQRRDGRLGPDAGARAAGLFGERGWTVVTAATPWRLGAGDDELARAWLAGRVEAAVEWRPDLADRAGSWLERRCAQSVDGALAAVVDHLDVLALPPAPWRRPDVPITGAGTVNRPGGRARIPGMDGQRVSAAPPTGPLHLATTGTTGPPGPPGPPGRLRHRPRRRRRWRRVLGAVATAAAFGLVWLVLVAPDDVRQLSPAAVLRIPAEGLVIAALLLALPVRATRTTRVIAWAVGLVLGVVVLLQAADYGSYQVLDRPAHPVADWQAMGAGLDYVSQTYGRAASVGVAIAAAMVAAGLPVLLAACMTRVAAVLRRRRGAAVGPLAVLVAVWGVLALVGTQLVPGQPVAARSVTGLAATQLERAQSDLSDQARFARQLSSDRSRATPAGVPLGALRGKDVIFAFVESYGRTALDDPTLSPGVHAVLDAGNRDLRAAGFSARSGFLKSSTFGGRSWLAHSTLMSGTWVDRQTRYEELLAGTHPTLVSDFRNAGWRTVATMPGTGRDWPEGSFYGYDDIYIGPKLGYKGPSFSWSPMPDQFVLSRIHQLELGPGRTTPVMATVELTSSHNPWAPLPTAVPWAAVGDGSVFAPQPRAGRQPDDVWKDPAQVRAQYGQAVEYSVSTLLSFMEQYGTEDTVLVFLGDHQPVKAVTGADTRRDVPVTIVAKDPAVLDRIASWGWTDGVQPSADAPLWTMDTFRERFLAAYGTPGAG